MNLRGHFGLFTVILSACAPATAADPVTTLTIARKVGGKGRQIVKLSSYPGVLLMQGMAELALASGDATDLEAARQALLPYATGKATIGGNFVSYRRGGNGAALLLLHAKLPEGRQHIGSAAADMHQRSARSKEGIILASFCAGSERVFIDTAFAVTPFLLWTGLAVDEEPYIEDAWQQIKKLHDILWDPATGLYHQGRGFQGDGVVSTDHWSRGNGWAALSWAALIGHLRSGDPRRRDAEKLFRQFVRSAARFQDAEGMWHQEMTSFESPSYAETSGTGLLLYAVGVGIERGVLDSSYREIFKRGLRGYLNYIGVDGSITHTSRSLLCPGNGTPEAYCSRTWVLNDAHAFGPAVLAFAQAHRIGIERIELAR
jgi:unsaturated rhamnogalacturonyl hydrolase